MRKLGGIGVAGAIGAGGIAAYGGSAVAASASISATSPGVVSNDRGDVSQVTIDPSFRVEWQNLDQAVGKVFYLVEAAVEDSQGRGPFNGNYSGSGFHPVFRAKPWIDQQVENGDLSITKPGTTGHYQVKTSLTQAMAHDTRFHNGTPPDASPHKLVIADGTGRPTYSNLSFPGGVTAASFLNGTSMGDAAHYTGSALNGEVLQNNFPDIDAGYYGAAMDTSLLDDDVDGTEKKTTVYLRYTFELQRPNSGEVGDGTLGQGVWEHVRASDVNTGNSEIVMNGNGGNYAFSNPSGIDYSTMQAHSSSVGIVVTHTSFEVDVKNQAASSTVTGSSHTGASGGGQ